MDVRISKAISGRGNPYAYCKSLDAYQIFEVPAVEKWGVK